MIYVMGREIKQEHFSAGELKIKLQPYESLETIEISWYYENDSEFFTLACIRDFYKNKKCVLLIPYFPHARMDRVKNPEDVFTLRTFCNLINSLDFNKVISCDVHSNVTPALVNNFINESPKHYINYAITTLGTDNLALFFPDEGAMKRYSEMFPSIPSAFGIKKRNWETQKIEGYTIMGEENIKGKCVLIIDDIQEFVGVEKTQNTFFHIFNHGNYF